MFGKPLDGSFFVAGVGVPCKTKKADRTADDLRRMGIVAALEMFVMARIKTKLPGSEPILNKK